MTTTEFIRRYVRNGGLPITKENETMPVALKLKKGKELEAISQRTGTKYDWDGWFNGDLQLIQRAQGTENDKGTVVSVTVPGDFCVPTDRFPVVIKTAARKRYKVCPARRRLTANDLSNMQSDTAEFIRSISEIDSAGNAKLIDAFVIQARDMTPGEKEQEDILRAEEKAAKATTPQADYNGVDETEENGDEVA